MSVVWMLSLSAMGIPCSGLRTRPWARSRSRVSACCSALELTVMAAFSRSSWKAMRARCWSTSSRESPASAPGRRASGRWWPRAPRTAPGPWPPGRPGGGCSGSGSWPRKLSCSAGNGRYEMSPRRGLALLLLCAPVPSLRAAEPDPALQALIQEAWEFRLREEPLFATSAGDHRYDDRLPSAAPADLERQAAFHRDLL